VKRRHEERAAAAAWASDINGDFIAGKRELPDGFIVGVRPSGK